MKHLQKKYVVIAMLIAIVTGLVYCTKRNQIIEEDPSTVNQLFSMKVSAGPAVNGTAGYVWDGAVDPIWNNAKKLTVNAIVPNPGNNTFPGYHGQSTDVTIRSVYDNQYIYFLAEWKSAMILRSTWWYFNPVTRLWAQESTAPVLDANGVRIRNGFNQDKFALIWNINNSSYAFNSQGCWVSCHLNIPTFSLNPITGVITTTPVFGSRMRTTTSTEKLDLWVLFMIQAQNFSQMSDTYVDWAGGAVNAGGRNIDPQVSTTDGGLTNRQTIRITGTTTNVTVPMWVIFNKTNYNAILVSDTANAVATKVTAVDANGILTFSNGNTIDPNSGTDYQQVGSSVGPKCIPGSIIGSYTGSRADITANVFYTGNGWRTIFKRLLNTGDTFAQDINFTGLADQTFDIAVFFNHASSQHAMSNGLKLRFEK